MEVPNERSHLSRTDCCLCKGNGRTHRQNGRPLSQRSEWLRGGQNLMDKARVEVQYANRRAMEEAKAVSR